MGDLDGDLLEGGLAAVKEKRETRTADDIFSNVTNATCVALNLPDFLHFFTCSSAALNSASRNSSASTWPANHPGRRVGRLRCGTTCLPGFPSDTAVSRSSRAIALSSGSYDSTELGLPT